MNRRSFLAASAGAVVALSGCLGGPGRALPERPTGAWRQSAHDGHNTGAADLAIPPRGTPAWDEGAAHLADPLVADGTVYSVAESATALDAKTGDQEWEVDLPGSAEHTPAVTEDGVIVATDRALVKLSRDDGNELWSKSLARPAEGPVTVDPPLVTVPLAPRRGRAGLLAFEASSGDRLWTDDLHSPRAAAIDDERVYATGYSQDGDTGVVRGLSREDGAESWAVELDHPDTPPVVVDGEILLGDAGTLAVHDPADGRRVRTLGSFGGEVAEPLAVDGGTAFVVTDDRSLVAVSVADGDTLWRRDVTVTAGTGVAVGREAVVAAVTDLPEASLAGVAAFERSDGTTRWGHGIEGFDAYASTAPVPADGAVFYASNESSGIVALGDLPPADEQ